MSIQRFHIHRFEFKYPLDQARYAAIKEEIMNYVEYDSYCLAHPDKAYMVYSLYYDNPDSGAFWEKIDGVKNRKKFRFRIYDLDPKNRPDVYLEIKRKKNVVIIKDRAKLSFDGYNDLVRHGDFSALDDKKMPVDQKNVLEEFLFHKCRDGIGPGLIVAYKREAFLGRHHHNVRITFDSDIHTYDSRDLFSPYKSAQTVLSKEIILELKFTGSLPFWFHYIIQKYDLSRVSHSKYCSSFITVNNIVI
jgi:hypothetical protein